MKYNFDSLNLEGYYANLSQKEKSLFLRYLMVEYDLGYSTIRQKLAGTCNSKLNTLERMACHEAIEKEELWRH